MDIALLKWSNIQNGRIRYEKAKTGKQYSISLLPPAMEIVDYFKIYNPDSEYVFPILISDEHNTPQDINSRIQRCRKITNSDLK